jgi:transposase
MMGLQSGQKELFSYSVDLDARVHSEHPLRKVREALDFGFVREQTACFYGRNGNESVDPAVVMKLMFLLFFDNVPSERELMRMLPYRLDYLWFLGFGLDDPAPHHSVLSKARRRWGTEVFETLFATTVAQCIDAGLVGGHKIHMDGCLIDADASKNSVVSSSPELITQLRKSFRDEMNKLDEPVEDGAKRYYSPKNKTMASTTDPDSEIVRKGKGESRPRYKTHRAVDDQCGVITAVETTPGGTAENDRLMPLVEQHEANTQRVVKTVVADTQYGTVDNFRKCAGRGIRSHMADVEAKQSRSGRAKAVYDRSLFIYNEDRDTYTCPCGHEMTRRKCKTTRPGYEYACGKDVCRHCPLRQDCTKSRTGRTIKRNINQELVDQGKAESSSTAARKDRVRRKWLMEGSFADGANNHGLKRARWRRLWRQRIQDLMIAAIQNMRKLINQPEWIPAMVESARISTATRPKEVLRGLFVRFLSHGGVLYA